MKGPAFSQAETDLLLAATPRAGLPKETIGKLDALDVFWSLDQFCRNLAVLLAS
jgi:hypothetical protein